jgi:hypothetical protein
LTDRRHLTTADRRHSYGDASASGKEDDMDHARLVAVGVLAGILVVECFGDVLLAIIKAWVMR